MLLQLPSDDTKIDTNVNILTTAGHGTTHLPAKIIILQDIN